MPVIINHGSVAFPLDMAAQVGSYRAAQDRQDEDWKRRQWEEQQRRNRIMEQRQQEEDRIAQQRIDESIAHNRETERLGGSRIDATISGQDKMGERQDVKHSQTLEKMGKEYQLKGDQWTAKEYYDAARREAQREFQKEQNQLKETGLNTRQANSVAARQYQSDRATGRMLNKQDYDRHWNLHVIEKNSAQRELDGLNRRKANIFDFDPTLDGQITAKQQELKDIMESMRQLQADAATVPTGPTPPSAGERYTSAGVEAPEGTVAQGPNGQRIQKRNGQWVSYP